MKWRTVKTSRILKSLLKIGWSVKRQRGSHKILTKLGWSDFTFAFRGGEEIGPRMLSRISKHTGLLPKDL